MEQGLSIEALGFTKEELQERLIEHIADRVMRSRGYDEDGDEVTLPSDLERRLKDAVTARIDSAVAKIAETHILPNAEHYIENITFQATNKWGEKQAASMTYREYLAKKAEEYLTEQVNYDGKSKAEDSYNFRGVQSRISHMVHRHLHYEIEKIMKAVVADENSKIAGGIQEAVKLKLGEILAGLKVNIALKSS